MFSLSWVYRLPDLKWGGWVGRQLIGGWQLNAILTAQSGQPVNITSGSDTNFDGNNNDRPDLVGDPAVSQERSRAQLIREFFNTEAFAPATGLYGSTGRNILYGPNAVNWDAAAFKEFRIHESHRIQLRGEFFNIFNQVNFGNPNGTLSSPNFGRITSAAAPRIVQFSAKYLF